MTPINLILIIVLIQIVGYILLDKINLKKGKYLFLAIILGLNLLVFPRYFFPDNPNHEPGCGLPILAITLVFWIIGCGLTIITHLTYKWTTKSLKKKNSI